MRTPNPTSSVSLPRRSSPCLEDIFAPFIVRMPLTTELTLHRRPLRLRRCHSEVNSTGSLSDTFHTAVRTGPARTDARTAPADKHGHIEQPGVRLPRENDGRTLHHPVREVDTNVFKTMLSVDVVFDKPHIKTDRASRFR